MKRHYNWIIMKAFPYRVISPVSTEAGHIIWKLSMKNIPRRIQLLVNLLSAHLLRQAMMTAMSPLLNGPNRNGLLRYQTTCPSTKPTCWISIIVWCCLVHPNMGQTLIIRCKVSRAIAITSYCELWQAREQQPGRIGISLKRYTDTLRYEIKTLTFWLTRLTAIVDHFTQMMSDRQQHELLILRTLIQEFRDKNVYYINCKFHIWYIQIRQGLGWTLFVNKNVQLLLNSVQVCTYLRRQHLRK